MRFITIQSCYCYIGLFLLNCLVLFKVSEFSQIVPAAMARARGKTVVDRLKTEIPRQQFEVTIKACSGSSTKAMAQAVIQPMKRDFSQLLKGNFGGGGIFF